MSSAAAIGNFTSFSIGANAVVDIRQTNAGNAFLARVTGSDPTQIYGLLKSNGTVMLVNQNGLMVGPGGVIFVASGTLHTVRNVGEGTAKYCVVQVGGDTKR